ncbi:hypothetical protein VSVS05_03468 [Vibrio scophthalmi]|uniref:Uncharacterized protein n=1 Tax=Vibrio scophthalmi TaxID=45658 RepID=A0A1C7FF20_9VIBR|nr:hypothetical protein VSVS05_03468 [Vibrio scophthalmi]
MSSQLISVTMLTENTKERKSLLRVFKRTRCLVAMG